MKIMNYEDVRAEEVSEKGATGAKIRWLITREDGAQNFSMRHFALEPGGFTPRHSHDWEHEVYILSGRGHVLREGEDVKIERGDFVFIPPGEEHQFRNKSDSTLTLICLIPNPD